MSNSADRGSMRPRRESGTPSEGARARGRRSSGARASTLAASLGGGDNALNLVRVVLASMVVLGHALPLGGFAPVVLGPFVYGGWHGAAVDAFFAISGFLIVRSALRMRARGFLWRRVLRIYPGYVVALVVTAFVIAPASIPWGMHWDAGEALRYVLGSLPLKTRDLPVHGDVPFPLTWNGSLWTLFYEALAYLGALIAVSLPVVRRYPRASTTSAAAVLWVGWLVIASGLLGEVPAGPLSGYLVNILRFGVHFACGAALFAWGDRLRASWWAAGPALVASLVILSVPATGALAALLPMLLALGVLQVGALLPLRIGSENDLSYGIYVYAFPVQQMLVVLGVNRWGLLITALASLVCVIPFAAASWFLVEKPAMRLRSLVPAVPRAPDAPARRP